MNPFYLHLSFNSKLGRSLEKDFYRSCAFVHRELFSQAEFLLTLRLFYLKNQEQVLIFLVVQALMATFLVVFCSFLEIPNFILETKPVSSLLSKLVLKHFSRLFFIFAEKFAALRLVCQRLILKTLRVMN